MTMTYHYYLFVGEIVRVVRTSLNINIILCIALSTKELYEINFLKAKRDK